MLARRTILYIASSLDGYIAKPNDDLNTRTARASVDKTQFYTGDLKDLVLKLKSETGKNIFIDGGAEVVHELLKQNLIDEFVISIIPILVGEGTRLFKDGRPEQGLILKSAKSFDKGLVQLHYTGGSN